MGFKEVWDRNICELRMQRKSSIPDALSRQESAVRA